jgi:hypothetical protein
MLGPKERSEGDWITCQNAADACGARFTYEVQQAVSKVRLAGEMGGAAGEKLGEAPPLNAGVSDAMALMSQALATLRLPRPRCTYTRCRRTMLPCNMWRKLNTYQEESYLQHFFAHILQLEEQRFHLVNFRWWRGFHTVAQIIKKQKH